ncbi:DUF6036 family nucleotidyltransferase [Mycobacterium sp.]|uniref:DUF6036 family nucleotidyltransferase n=1 Tax=Mycobacterium sp. TaxID=1785 RepID=UPI0031D93DDB
MNRAQLAHLLRSACTVAHDADVLVLGSQSILGSFEDDDLPAEATASQEADVAFLDDPGMNKADEVEGAIGEMSPFHERFGVYAEGVHLDVATKPDGWKDRLVTWDVESSKPAEPRFLDPHDLAVSKLAAGRPKDLDFVLALIRDGLLNVALLRERASMLPAETDPRIGKRIQAWLDFAAGKASQAGPPRSA